MPIEGFAGVFANEKRRGQKKRNYYYYYYYYYFASELSADEAHAFTSASTYTSRCIPLRQ